MNEHSKKFEYSGKTSGYVAWANAMWQVGFNLSTKELASKMNISLSWVNHTLLHEISYVVYSVNYVWQCHHSRDLTYIRESDFIEWMMKVATFEVQTEIVDLYSYIENKKVANEILAFYKEDFKQNEGFYNEGTLPRPTIKFIEDKCYSYGMKLQNVNCTKRKDIPYVHVDPFNIFEHDYYVVSGTAELAYREAFLRGDIKVKLGSKTYFVRNKLDIDNFKIPFVIPYGKVIKLRPK